MECTDINAIQKELGLSDGKMAKALGVTRQTWRNWRTGRPCPPFAQNAIRWMMTLRSIDPANDNLPQRIKASSGEVRHSVQHGGNGADNSLKT